MYSSTLPSTSALDVGGQRHDPAALPSAKTRYPMYRRLVGSQDRSGRVQKILPLPGFDPRTVQPVASRCTDWAITAPALMTRHFATTRLVAPRRLCAVWNTHTQQGSPAILTYCMVQSPSWETNWFAASQEIPRISRNPKVHYCTHKRPPPVSILGQPNPVHILTSHLLEIHPNIIHPSTPRSPQWSLSFRFPQQDPPLTTTLKSHCSFSGISVVWCRMSRNVQVHIPTS